MADHESMVEVFLYETRNFLEQLEQLALGSEDAGAFAPEDVNEIFRAMHTIKGSAAMMMLTDISTLAHSVEDIFFYLRELHPQKVDVSSITDLVLEAVDFMKGEMDRLADGETPDASSAELRQKTEDFLRAMKVENGDDPDVDLRKAKSGAQPKPQAAPPKAQQYYIAPAKAEPSGGGGKLHVYEAVLHFEPDCGMVEVRAFTIVNNLKEHVAELHFLPEKILEDDQAPEAILRDGFRLWFTSAASPEDVKKILDGTSYLTGLDFRELASTAECGYWPSAAEQAAGAAVDAEPIVPAIHKETADAPPPQEKTEKQPAHPHHEEAQVISVRVDKLDRLMDLVGELVIAESMVTQNPDLAGLELDNFQKAARQLHKVGRELQDSVMSLRMVPVDPVFKRMNRIVRDMTKKLCKKARLVLVGADTEVDKTISEHLGDPLMHIVRNSIDHGIELPERRKELGKPESGTVTLSAANEGGEVVIKITDDGSGMDRAKILEKARQKGLLTKPEAEYTDKEVYNFIFAPGFSTNDQVTEYSGRGVGMDVVVSNIKALGGKVTVDSTPGQGSTTTIRIPLTLAIVDGMNLEVGSSSFTLPISAIRRSFRPEASQVFIDAEGREMLIEDGRCCPIVRLGQVYGIEDAEPDLTQGILLLVESEDRLFALAADRLLGVQQIVVKPLSAYLGNVTKTTGITSCTLLGDGSISLIIDPAKTAELIYTS